MTGVWMRISRRIFPFSFPSISSPLLCCAFCRGKTVGMVADEITLLTAHEVVDYVTHTHTQKRIGMIKMMMMTAEFLAAFPNLVKQMIIKLTLSFWCNVDVFFSSARVVMELLNFRSSPCSCLAFLSAAIRNRIRWSGGMQMNDAETSCCFL